jgi:Tfp pilus assembly protein PilF
MAYFKNGDKANAMKELKKALELNPKFSGAEEARNALKLL